MPAKLLYAVSKSSEGEWYAHAICTPNIPVISVRGTFFKTRRAAERLAAECDMLPLAEWKSLA